MLAWVPGRLNPFRRLLKNNGFKDDAGRANRVVRHSYTHGPGIQQEPPREGNRDESHMVGGGAGMPGRLRQRDGTAPAAGHAGDQRRSGARTQPSMVYVTDFDLEFPQGSPSQDTASMRQGPLARLRERLQGGDPVTKAHAAVGMMAASITDDLNEDGVPAQRLSASDPKPTSGWLVRGGVTELDQGNQLRRAMVGFGAGASELQLWVGVTDLARHPDVPFYTLDASDGSG